MDMRIIMSYSMRAIVDKITYRHLHSDLVMDILTQHLRLLLIVAIALSPIQPLFAMQTGQQADDSQTDDSMAVSMTHPMDVMITTAGVSNTAQNDVSKMLNGDCNKRGKCSNCQGANHCSSCPLSLGISQIASKRTGLSTQIQLAVSDVSLHSTDLLPDYRPPRYS